MMDLDTTISRLMPVIARELRETAITGGKSPAATLNHIFDDLFGRERDEQDRQRFLFLVCPMARRVVLGLSEVSEEIGNTGVRVKDLQECMSWLDAHDPIAARMIDLRYFAGRSVKQTAAALQMTPDAVVKQLQFTRVFITVKLRQPQ